VYTGYGEFNRTRWVPFERLDLLGSGDYYTGFFQLFDMNTGPYVAIAESSGFHYNFQKLYSAPQFPKQMRPIPLVSEL